jgi:hypothetical protein
VQSGIDADLKELVTVFKAKVESTIKVEALHARGHAMMLTPVTIAS